MKPQMTVGAFLLYSLFGLVGLGISSAVFYGCIASDYGVHPQYRAYLEQQKQFEKARENIDRALVQRRFEEALAGAFPIDQLPSADLQEVARELLADRDRARESKLPINVEWAAGLPSRMNGNANLKDRKWNGDHLLFCHVDAGFHCHIHPIVSVVNDPHRLVMLMNGDVRGVLSTLPKDENLQPPPPYPADAPKEVAKPWWLGLYGWLIMSFGFMLTFVISGYIWHAATQDRDVREKFELKEPLPGPLVPMPNFALGWIGMALAAPGFAIAYFVRATTLDARPTIDRLRRKFSGKAFNDEYVDVDAELRRLKERAAALGNPALTAKAEALLLRIKEHRNGPVLAGLQRSLEKMDRHLDSIEELERDLQRSSDAGN